MNSICTRQTFPFVFVLIFLFPFFPCKGIAAIPKAPATLDAVAVSPTQITLTWADASTDETGFELEQSTDGTKFTKLADLPANAVTYPNTLLTPATKYWYRIRSRNASGVSAYSNIATTTTLPLPTIPKAPSALAAVPVSVAQINLTWTDNATDETGFELEVSVDAVTFTKIADLGVNIASYQHTGLSPATRYWYRVLAKNAAGKSVYSNIANATTLQAVPIAPGNLTATPVSTAQIDLKWADNAGNETGFQVERSLNGTAFTKIADLAANVTSYQNTGLTAATQYYYRVRAVNAAGASAYSNVGAAKTLNIPVPDAPVNFTAVPLALDLIQLRWAAVTGNATEVIIERAKNSDEQFKEIRRQPASVLQYEDREQLEPADYYYRIKAVNAGGASAYSLIAIVPASSVITAVESLQHQHQVYMAGSVLVIELARPADARFRLYDLNGIVRKEQSVGQYLRTEVGSLPAGVYIVAIDTGKEVISRRILLY
nr:fibronectin type III domain-containing protein [uncultured Dyadobacter sp.]